MTVLKLIGRALVAYWKAVRRVPSDADNAFMQRW